jgi:hypothetical protein
MAVVPKLENVFLLIAFGWSQACQKLRVLSCLMVDTMQASSYFSWSPKLSAPWDDEYSTRSVVVRRPTTVRMSQNQPSYLLHSCANGMGPSSAAVPPVFCSKPDKAVPLKMNSPPNAIRCEPDELGAGVASAPQQGVTTMDHAAISLAARGDFSLHDLVFALLPFLSRRQALLMCMLIRSVRQKELTLTATEFQQHVEAVLGESAPLLVQFTAMVAEAQAFWWAFGTRKRRRSKLERRLRAATRSQPAKRLA